MVEIERKYRVCAPGLVRRRLRSSGALRLSAGREDNLFFDCGGLLLRKRLALRLRRKAGRGLLTLKGPRRSVRYSRRLEIETPVDFDAARAILGMAGFRVFARYSKRREEYRLRGCLVTLDFVPSLKRWFLEIEGSVRGIDNLERHLGLGEADAEPRTYFQMVFGIKD